MHIEDDEMPIAIGDVQGCLHPLKKIIDQINLSQIKYTCLWFVGDVINRGPESLATLKYVMALKEQAKMVLGNHELHLLSVAAGVRTLHADDTLTEILQAPDAEIIINWLRNQPLIISNRYFLMVHAGLLPSWTVIQANILANQLHQHLKSDHWQSFLKHMNQPLVSPQTKLENIFSDNDADLQNALAIMTRIRLCHEDGRPDWLNKHHPQHSPSRLPWFEFKNRLSASQAIVFGHWSALGLVNQDKILGIDTGCVWGQELTAAQLKPLASERKFWQIKNNLNSN